MCFSKIDTMAYFLKGPLVVIWIFFFFWIVRKTNLCISRILLLDNTGKASLIHRIFSADMAAYAKLHSVMALLCLTSTFFNFSLVFLLGQENRNSGTWLILVALLVLTREDCREGWFLSNWDLALNWKVILSAVLIWSHSALYIANTNVQAALPNGFSWGISLSL